MALLGLFSYDCGVSARTFRQRIGDRFLHYRHQVKGLVNLEDARRETNTDPKTIRGIETGVGNPRLTSLEDYANGLGVDLERIISEAIAAGAPKTISPEAQSLASIYEQLKDINSRRLLLQMAEQFRGAEPQIVLEPDQTQSKAELHQARDREPRTRARKAGRG